MRNIRLFLIAATAGAFFMAGCVSKEQLKKTIEDNPEIITDAIKKNPLKFMDALQEAANEAKKQDRDRQAQQEQKDLEEEFKNPKQAEVSDTRVVFGPKTAPVTIIEYSDFECPFCSRGYQVMQQVKQKYGEKVRIVYKHLPLSFHPEAEPAARYFEAVAEQGHDKAEKFHDIVFQNQERLKSEKDKFLQDAAKKAGADVKKVLGAINSSKVSETIKKDSAEAEKFGFSGTPGFLVNGVSVKGAYPFEYFEKIIDRHLGGK